jgi:UDP-N-acetylmuramoylalanine--D-glutamate ligase
MQIFFSQVKLTGATTVGITGTKGKSTTTALAAHILKSAGRNVVLAGNIGVSPLLGLESANTDTIFVLELSSYQLSDLKVGPHISACVNLFNDHTNWHGSLENYWEAKHNIMRFARDNDIFIYNPDFEPLRAWAEEANCRTIAINKYDDFSLNGAKLFGEHNRLNGLVAREIARQFGVSDELTQHAIISFEPLRHRMQFVATKNSLAFIDDAIGMTPESTSASLKAVSQKYGPVGCLLLGGQDRGYDFTLLMNQIVEQAIPNIVLFPDTIQKMKAAFPADYQPKIFETSSMDEAVDFASKNSPKNSVVLLSTAAPSYSIWRDFEEKGDLFQQAVNRL